jgi:hypothetical protein
VKLLEKYDFFVRNKAKRGEYVSRVGLIKVYMSVFEETSANNKVLRSRTVPIDKTDPKLRAKIVEGVWPKITEVKLAVNALKKTCRR